MKFLCYFGIWFITFSLQDQRNCIVLDYHEVYTIKYLLLREQGGHCFLSKEELMQWKSSLLNQQDEQDSDVKIQGKLFLLFPEGLEQKFHEFHELVYDFYEEICQEQISCLKIVKEDHHFFPFIS